MTYRIASYQQNLEKKLTYVGVCVKYIGTFERNDSAELTICPGYTYIISAKELDSFHYKQQSLIGKIGKLLTSNNENLNYCRLT